MDADVKAICEVAGISRKTGYQWAGKSAAKHNDVEHSLRQELDRIKAEHTVLQKRYDDVRFEMRAERLRGESTV